MDNIDRRLLDIIQAEFPLASEPYRAIASLLSRLDADSVRRDSQSTKEVILRLRRLKDEGIIRRIGAIFDSKKLGYCSTLCAMKVPTRRVDEVAEIVNEYPGVTHNYIRTARASKSWVDLDDFDEYNMWFTITARSRQELDRIIAEIKEKSGIDDLLDLPAVRRFKIRVQFSMLDAGCSTLDTRCREGKAPGSADILPAFEPYPASGIKHPESRTSLTEVEKHIVREFQGDIPLCQRPFKPTSDKLGIAEEELLAKIRELKDRGVIRRLGAILHHRNVGFNANAMGVWRVPEEEVEQVGAKMAAFPQVSHCYQRVIRPDLPHEKVKDWPYNVFTMIHGKTREDCEQAAKLISQDTKIRDYRLLYSVRELKKVSMRYFDE